MMHLYIVVLEYSIQDAGWESTYKHLYFMQALQMRE